VCTNIPITLKDWKEREHEKHSICCEKYKCCTSFRASSGSILSITSDRKVRGHEVSVVPCSSSCPLYREPLPSSTSCVSYTSDSKYFTSRMSGISPQPTSLKSEMDIYNIYAYMFMHSHVQIHIYICVYTYVYITQVHVLLYLFSTSLMPILQSSLDVKNNVYEINLYFFITWKIYCPKENSNLDLTLLIAVIYPLQFYA